MAVSVVFVATAALMTVQAVFAGYQILGKLVISSGLNPIALALFRELSSSFVFLTAVRILVPRAAWPRREHFGRFLLCGFSMFGNVFLNIVALTMTTASVVALLQPTQPIIASVVTTCLGHEQMSLRKAIGILLSCLGSLLMALWKHSSAGRVNFGILVVLAQCFSGANYVVHQRPLVLMGYSPLTVSSFSYVGATMLTVVTGGIYFAVLTPTERSTVEWYQPTAMFVVVVLYMVFLTTVYNYVVMAWATGKLGATVVTLFGLLQGIFASCAEWQLYGRHISIGQALAALAIFAGLVIVVLDPAKTGYVDTRSTWAGALSSRSLSNISESSLGMSNEGFCGTVPAEVSAEKLAAPLGAVHGDSMQQATSNG